MWNHLRTSLAILVVMTLALPSPAAAPKTTIDIGFETGDFGDWSTAGATTVETDNIGFAPLSGTYQALVQSHLEGFDGIPISDLESFLHLPANSLMNLAGASTPATQGSAISRVITANAGDVISCDFLFLTNENFDPAFVNPDFFFMSLDGTLTKLAAPSQAQYDSPVSLFGTYSDYISKQISIPISGLHTIAFGVVDVNDTFTSSAVLLSNVQLATAVPEPNSMFLSIFGVCGLRACARIRR